MASRTFVSSLHNYRSSEQQPTRSRSSTSANTNSGARRESGTAVASAASSAVAPSSALPVVSAVRHHTQLADRDSLQIEVTVRSPRQLTDEDGGGKAADPNLTKQDASGEDAVSGMDEDPQHELAASMPPHPSHFDSHSHEDLHHMASQHSHYEALQSHESFAESQALILKSRDALRNLQVELQSERSRRLALEGDMAVSKKELANEKSAVTALMHDLALLQDKETRLHREVALYQANEAVYRSRIEELERDVQRLSEELQVAAAAATVSDRSGSQTPDEVRTAGAEEQATAENEKDEEDDHQEEQEDRDKIGPLTSHLRGAAPKQEQQQRTTTATTREAGAVGVSPSASNLSHVSRQPPSNKPQDQTLAPSMEATLEQMLASGLASLWARVEREYGASKQLPSKHQTPQDAVIPSSSSSSSLSASVSGAAMPSAVAILKGDLMPSDTAALQGASLQFIRSSKESLHEIKQGNERISGGLRELQRDLTGISPVPAAPASTAAVHQQQHTQSRHHSSRRAAAVRHSATFPSHLPPHMVHSHSHTHSHHSRRQAAEQAQAPPPPQQQQHQHPQPQPQPQPQQQLMAAWGDQNLPAANTTADSAMGLFKAAAAKKEAEHAKQLQEQQAHHHRTQRAVTRRVLDRAAKRLDREITLRKKAEIEAETLLRRLDTQLPAASTPLPPVDPNKPLPVQIEQLVQSMNLHLQQAKQAEGLFMQRLHLHPHHHTPSTGAAAARQV